MRCEVQEADDAVSVALRCSDCMTWLEVSLSRTEMEELDRCQAEWREEIVAAYERSVSESMEALAAILGPALEQDLVGADDFARGGRVKSRPRPRAGS
jgi:threonine synthase